MHACGAVASSSFSHVGGGHRPASIEPSTSIGIVVGIIKFLIAILFALIVFGALWLMLVLLKVA